MEGVEKASCKAQKICYNSDMELHNCKEGYGSCNDSKQLNEKDFSRKRAAFTLAEVLITLGIIGVVAAVVMPTIINDIQDRQLTAMWKKKYSEISNIYFQTREEIGGGNLCVDNKGEGYSTSISCSKIGQRARYTTLSPEFVDKFVSHLKVVDSCGKPEYGESKQCRNFTHKWIGYCNTVAARGYYTSLKQNKTLKGSTTSTSCNTAGGLYTGWDMAHKAVLLADGSVIYFGGHATGIISVDVNGFSKGPNVVGRDVFAVMVNEDWAKPLGAEGTFNTGANGTTCECSKDYGLESGQGFMGSSDLLNGQVLSGTCCSATKLSK